MEAIAKVLAPGERLKELDSSLNICQPVKRQVIEEMMNILDNDKRTFEIECIRGLYIEHLLRQISQDTANPPD